MNAFTAPHAVPTSDPAAKAGPPPDAGESTAGPTRQVVKVTPLPSIDHTSMIQSVCDAAHKHAARPLGQTDQRFSRAVKAALRWYRLSRTWRHDYQQALDEAQKHTAELDNNHDTILALKTQVAQLEAAAAASAALKAENEALTAANADLLDGLALIRARFDHHNVTSGSLCDRVDALAARAPTAPAVQPGPHDALTLAYLRHWWTTLTPDQQADQPALLRDLVQPWHQRGTAWITVVRAAEGTTLGLTPAQMSRATASQKAAVKLGG